MTEDTRHVRPMGDWRVGENAIPFQEGWVSVEYDKTYANWHEAHAALLHNIVQYYFGVWPTMGCTTSVMNLGDEGVLPENQPAVHELLARVAALPVGETGVFGAEKGVYAFWLLRDDDDDPSDEAVDYGRYIPPADFDFPAPITITV